MLWASLLPAHARQALRGVRAHTEGREVMGLSATVGIEGCCVCGEPRRRVTDRCLICGRFVGSYPQEFYCDTHCARCICEHCPPVESYARSVEERLRREVAL